MITRRDLLHTGFGATALLLGVPRSLFARGRARRPDGDRPYLEAARQAERWIRKSRIETAHGVTWLADPNDPQSLGTSLYTHSPGVVLFLLELYHTTGDAAYRDEACRGADHLIGELEGGEGTGAGIGYNGLYTGLAGVAYSLERTSRVSGRGKYRAAADRALRLLEQRAQRVGAGVQWGDTTDIIFGGAGIGLTLLHAARALNDRAAGALAVRAGHRLIELALPAAGGLMWTMPEVPQQMPNFSHGTAGVAYFLATLYGDTREPAFLNAALAGARYLLSIARTERDVLLVYHHEGDGTDLFYLGWCHGPCGTARLFYRLGRVTADSTWLTWVRRAARGVMESGIPEQRTPGFWNNVSQCCGDTAVAQFCLDLHRAVGDRAYLEFSRRATADMLHRATTDGDGLKWIQAEHRVRPELLVAQTGFMQGAAGMGTFLLQLDQFERAGRPAIVLPDTPF
ncbi:MAG: lanthionine synthetase LanC family protein [Gemmatimonadales bacterium]